MDQKNLRAIATKIGEIKRITGEINDLASPDKQTVQGISTNQDFNTVITHTEIIAKECDKLKQTLGLKA